MRGLIRQPQLGVRLRALRKRAKLSRAELARATGVSVGSIARLEAGKDVRVSVYLAVLDHFIARVPEPWMAAQHILDSDAGRSEGEGEDT